MQVQVQAGRQAGAKAARMGRCAPHTQARAVGASGCRMPGTPQHNSPVQPPARGGSGAAARCRRRQLVMLVLLLRRVGVSWLYSPKIMVKNLRNVIDRKSWVAPVPGCRGGRRAGAGVGTSGGRGW